MTRQVLTINVLVPCAAGLVPAAQPWLLWMVYSIFTSHVDIAFHTTVCPPATVYAYGPAVAAVSIGAGVELGLPGSLRCVF